MRLFALYRVELRRLILSKPVWLIAILCLCAPLLGYSVYKPTFSTVMTGLYIANPVLAGTTVGAILWTVITILETSRLHRSNTVVITDSIASPITLSAARMMAMMTLSAAVTVLCALVYLPFTAAKLNYLFHADFYFANFLVFMLPTWWISILFAESFYQITRRIELAVILYVALIYFSFSEFASWDYFLRWINPFVTTYSDGFPTLWPIRIGLYTRLIWLCIALGIWFVSLLCIRKYQKNLVASFCKGLKKIYLPLFAVIFYGSAVALWVNQPFIDHGPDEYIQSDNTIYECEVISYAHYYITTDSVTGTISGKAEYNLIQPFDGEAVLKLNPGYEIKSITYNGEKVDFRTVDDDINGCRSTYFTLPNEPGKMLVIEYGGFPTVEHWTNYLVSDSIDEDYISLRGEALFPRMENYVCQTAYIDITIPDTLTPYLDFTPIKKFTDNQDGTRTWNASCNAYVMSFIAANYVTDTITADETVIDFVYGEAYRTAVEEHDAVQGIVDVFEYCTNHYGAFGFAHNNRVLLQQASSLLMGGYATTGMSMWFENVLSPSTLSDSAKGADATDVFIHEMVHQWWGDFGLKCEDDGLWSAEGLTVYSTYRIVKEKYGELYAKQYYVDQWEKAVDEQNRNFYNRHPEYLDLVPEKYQADIKTANSSINKYMRMPLMILKAEKLVGGEEKMDVILSAMYADRESYSYNTGFTYHDFLTFCGLTEDELRLDKNIWL